MSECLAVHYLPGKGARDPQLRGDSDALEGHKDSKIVCQQSATHGVRLHPRGLGGCMEMSIA